jgi:alpha-beta hydrolase superfamily lysophospholipase
VPPVSGSVGTATPLWFGPPDRPLFGWLHVPVGGTARAAAVLCPPLGHERVVTHYTYRRLAEELACRGVLTVRFDYDGNGDSWGGDDDPDRVASWLRSIEHAVALARRSGSESVVLVGMRAGALLAAESAGAADADALVLWDPCKSGASFLREQHALQRVHFSDVGRADGAMEIPGFVFCAGTIEDLGHLEYRIECPRVRNALVLTRANGRMPEPLAQSLTHCQVDIEVAVGQGALIEVDPLHQQIPLVAIETIVSWVDGLLPSTRVSVTVPSDTSSDVSVNAGVPLHERALRFGSAGLFGIETRPALGAAGPTVFFVTSSFDSHIGLNRLWVLLARRWAAAGLRCIRFDVSGHGDSPSRSGQPEHVMRSPDAFDDLADAASALCPDDPSDVVWVGLCSGGYQVLEECLVHNARGVCAINPILRFRPPETDFGPLDRRRILCQRPTTISRAARRLPETPLLSPVRSRLMRRTRVLESEVVEGSWVQALLETDVDALFICGREEGDVIEADISDHDLGAPPAERFDLQVIPNLDHGLMPAAQRIDVMERLTNHVIPHFCGPNHATSTRLRRR